MTIKGFPEDSPARYKPAAPRFGTGTRRGPPATATPRGRPGRRFPERDPRRSPPRSMRPHRSRASPVRRGRPPLPGGQAGPGARKTRAAARPGAGPFPGGPGSGEGARSAAGPGAAPGAGPRRAGRAGRGGPTAGSPCARRVIGGGSGAAYRRPWSLPSGPRPAPLPAEENTCPERGRGRAQRWVAPFRARRRTLPQAGAARRRGLAAARGRAARTGNPAVRLRGPGRLPWRAEASGLGLLARLRCVPQLRFSRGLSAPAAMSAGATAGALGPAPASRSRLRPARGRATRSALRAIRLCWVVSRHRGPQGGAECVRARRVFRSAWPLCRVRAWPDDELQDWWETLRVKLLVCRSNCAKWVICLPAPLRSAT